MHLRTNILRSCVLHCNWKEPEREREGESEREMDRTRKKEREMRKGIERETEQ